MPRCCLFVPRRGVCLQAAGVSIEGHPDSLYNSVYKQDATHEGWPILVNSAGVYCYRHVATEKWLLHDSFTPESGTCCSCIDSPDGPLPVGPQSWAVGTVGGATGDMEVRTLTVTLLVRQHNNHHQSRAAGLV